MKYIRFLIAVFLVIFPVASANAADILMVPSEFPTIQTAVDAANPAGGDIVMVGPGEYAGAVITNPVKIVGSGDDTRITSGTYLFATDAFILVGDIYDVEGTEIRNLTIEYEGMLWGVYGEMSDNVTISNVTVRNALVGIDNHFGNGWTVVHNTVDGLRAPDGATGVIAAGIRTWGTASHNLIAQNDIYHEGVAATPDPAAEIWGGIGLVGFGEPSVKNNVHHNRVHISVPDVQCYNLVLVDYGALLFELPVFLTGNKVHHNRSWGECAGISFFPDEVSDYTRVHHNKWAN